MRMGSVSRGGGRWRVGAEARLLYVANQLRLSDRFTTAHLWRACPKTRCRTRRVGVSARVPLGPLERTPPRRRGEKARVHGSYHAGQLVTPLSGDSRLADGRSISPTPLAAKPQADGPPPYSLAAGSILAAYLAGFTRLLRVQAQTHAGFNLRHGFGRRCDLSRGRNSVCTEGSPADDACKQELLHWTFPYEELAPHPRPRKSNTPPA